MRQHLIALTAFAALLPVLGAPAMAEEQPAVDGPAQIVPDPGKADSSAGDVTAQGREHLPDDTTKTPVTQQEVGGAASPEIDTQPAAGSHVVSEEMVRELNAMGLEQQKKAATPPLTKSEEAKAAEKRAIAAHRDGFFARIEERL